MPVATCCITAWTRLTPSDGTHREITFVGFRLLTESIRKLRFRTNICWQYCHLLFVAIFKAPLSPSPALVCRVRSIVMDASWSDSTTDGFVTGYADEGEPVFYNFKVRPCKTLATYRDITPKAYTLSKSTNRTLLTIGSISSDPSLW